MLHPGGSNSLLDRAVLLIALSVALHCGVDIESADLELRFCQGFNACNTVMRLGSCHLRHDDAVPQVDDRPWSRQ